MNNQTPTYYKRPPTPLLYARKKPRQSGLVIMQSHVYMVIFVSIALFLPIGCSPDQVVQIAGNTTDEGVETAPVSTPGNPKDDDPRFVTGNLGAWWETWGKPYIKPEIGIFLTPEQPIFIPAATWTHLFDVELPCLSHVLELNETESWTKLVNQVTMMLNNVGTRSNITFSRMELEHMQYLNRIQTNIANFLVGIKEHITRIDKREQYVYDYMEPICPPIDANMFRDVEGPRSALQRLTDALGDTDYPFRADGDINYQEQTKITLWDLENTATKEALRKMIADETNKLKESYDDMHASHNIRLMDLEQNKIPVPNKTRAKIDMSGADVETISHDSRRKRSLPDTYAQVVYQQFINHANFTNLANSLPSLSFDSLLGKKDSPSDSPQRRTTYSSQVIDVQSNRVTSTRVPVVVNHAPIAPTHPPTTMRTTTPESADRIIRRGTPKESLYERLRVLLSSASQPDGTMTREELYEAINTYYEPILTDIMSISSDKPLPITKSQLGIVTLKVCYSWLRPDGNITSSCADRYVHTVKTWTPRCGGNPLDDTMYQSDYPGHKVPDNLLEIMRSIDVKNAVTHVIDNSHLLRRDRNQYPSSRSKRGLGDSIMETFWKPMFGAASQEDIDKIKKFLKTNKNNTDKLFQNQKLMMSLQRQSENRIDAISLALKNITEVLSITLHSSRSDLDKLLKDTMNIKGAQAVAETLMAIGTLQRYIHNALTLLKFKLNEISSTYQTLYSMIRGRYISPSFLSGETLDDLTSGLRDFNNPNYIIAPTWSRLSTMDDRSASLMVNGRHILISLKIPLILKTSAYTTYQAHSIPFRVENKIMQALKTDPYYIIDKTNKKWATLSSHEYSICVSNPGQICPYSFPMHSLTSPDCFSAILAVEDLKKPNKLCKIEYMGDDKTYQFPVQSFLGQTLSSNQWVISILHKDGLLAYEICDDVANNNAIQTATRTLNGINVIKVTEGCRVQVGDSTFSTSTNWRTNTHRSVQFQDGLLIDTSGLGDLKIWKMSSLINETLTNATIFSFPSSKVPGKKSYLFKNNIAEVGDILNMLQTKNLSTQDVGLLEPDDEDIPDFHLETPSHWNFSHWQIWSLIFGSVPVILLVSLFAYVVFKFIFIKPRSAATVAFSALPTSFTRADQLGGQVIVPNGLDRVLKDLLQKVDGQMANWTLQNATIQHIPDHLQPVNYLMPIIMMTMMSLMLILAFYHCWCLYKQSSLIRAMIRAACQYPKNRAVTMHNVEEPVIIVFLATIKLFGRKEPVVTTMAIQVCTLPSPYSQWMVKDRSYVKLMSSTTTLNRRHKTLIIQFNWTHLCILSNLLPNLDTCEDMPQQCIIPTSDLDACIDGGLPWNWTSVHQGHVIKVEVGRLGASKTIYSYQEDATGSMSTVPLLTPMDF